MKKRLFIVATVVVALLVAINFINPEAQKARACLCEPISGICC